MYRSVRILRQGHPISQELNAALSWKIFQLKTKYNLVTFTKSGEMDRARHWSRLLLRSCTFSDENKEAEIHEDMLVG